MLHLPAATHCCFRPFSPPETTPPPCVCARLSTSVAQPQVQVVTHLCYSDFQDIMKAVDDMDGEGLLGVWGVGVCVEGVSAKSSCA